MAIANNIPYSFAISYNDVLKGSNSYPELPDAAFSGFAGMFFIPLDFGETFLI